MRLHIGIDLDNTIVIYDEVFHRYAVEVHSMPSSIAPDKPSVRSYYWGRNGGREEWIELQGIVYGCKMPEAKVASGFVEFAQWCMGEGVEVSIISHKTEYPARGPRVSLHAAAWDWLEGNGFFDPKVIGMQRDHVFFEVERSEKISRISSQECAVFIDDLPEVLTDPLFPMDVHGILYDPMGRHLSIEGKQKFPHWRDIENYIRSRAGK